MTLRARRRAPGDADCCTRSGGSDSGRSSAHPIRRATTVDAAPSPALAPSAPLPPLPSSCPARRRAHGSEAQVRDVVIGYLAWEDDPRYDPDRMEDEFPAAPGGPAVAGREARIGGSVLRLAGPGPEGRPRCSRSRRPRCRREASSTNGPRRGAGRHHRPAGRLGGRAGAPWPGAGRARPAAVQRHGDRRRPARRRLPPAGIPCHAEPADAGRRHRPAARRRGAGRAYWCCRGRAPRTRRWARPTPRRCANSD